MPGNNPVAILVVCPLFHKYVPVIPALPPDMAKFAVAVPLAPPIHDACVDVALKVATLFKTVTVPVVGFTG